MSTPSTKIALALAIGLVLVQVSPVAADLLVCMDDRPDRGCCDTSSTPDGAARSLDGSECSCCVRGHVVSNAAGAATHKVDANGSVEAGGVRGPVAPTTGHVASLGSDEPDNPRLPSLRTIVLLI